MVDDEVLKVLDDLDSIRGRAAAAIPALLKEREKIDEQLRTLRRIAGELAPKSPAAVAKKQYPSTGIASDRAMAILAKAILDMGKEQFTALEVHRTGKLPWSEPHTYTTLKSLRKLEFVAQVGTTRTPTGNKANLYKVLDRHAVEHLIGAGNGQG